MSSSDEIVPKHTPKRPVAPVSVKFSPETLKRLARVSKTTGNSRNATINHLVEFALAEWERKNLPK